MFKFEDIIKLDDRSLLKILREIDNRELSMALKQCSPELKQKFLDNMSIRAATMIQEEVEALGTVQPGEIEEAHQRIIEIVKKLNLDRKFRPV